MIAQIQKIGELAKKASGQYVQAGRAPAADMPAVIDSDSDDKANAAVLYGSIVRASKGGATTMYAVPATGDVFSTANAVTKISLISKWGEAAKWHKLEAIGTVEGVLLGVLTMPTAAGAHAGELTLGGLPARISPGASGDTADKISVRALLDPPSPRASAR